MSRHRHHTGARAWRFVLAKLRNDWLAEHFLIQECGTCACCWAVIADRLAAALAHEIHAGCDREFALSWVADRIDEALDDETAA